MTAYLSDSGTVRIEVVDTGQGIPGSVQPRVFNAFTQHAATDGLRSREAAIGLTIVKTLVDVMGGTVDVKSEIRHGTKVMVRLSMK